MARSKWRRIVLGIIVLLAGLIVTGCAEGTFHVSLNKDGSAELNYNVGVDRSLMGLLSLGGDNLLLDMRRDAEQEGYQVSSYSTDRITGITVTKTLPSVENAGLDLNIFSFSNPFIEESDTEMEVLDEPLISINEGIFHTTYSAKGNVDLTAMDLNLPNQLIQLGGAALGQINLEFMITLPIKPSSHNADEVRNNGYTLVWSINPGEINEIEVEGKVPNVKKSIYFFLLLVVSGIVGGMYYLIETSTRTKAKENHVSDY